jgi:hypothetical protein
MEALCLIKDKPGSDENGPMNAADLKALCSLTGSDIQNIEHFQASLSLLLADKRRPAAEPSELVSNKAPTLAVQAGWASAPRPSVEQVPPPSQPGACPAEDGTQGIDRGSPKRESSARKPQERNNDIYCKPCELWLNGSGQWADHEMGKKHRKRVEKHKHR